MGRGAAHTASMAEAMTNPPVDDDFRCAVWTANQGFDPIGSATSFDRLVTVEVPQPWPADVGDMDWIAPIDVPDGTHVQAIVPETGRLDGSVLLTRWERTGARLCGIDLLVAAEDIRGALQLLVSGEEPAGDVSEAPAEVLICSHGARDRCCGGPGTRLAVEVRAAGLDVRIRRTSHLGGHRYAPTTLTLPDGRMWAYLDADALVGIVERTIPAAEAREFYRGNVALDPWAQVVEAAVLEEGGWSAVDFDELAASSELDGDLTAVTLTWTAGSCTDEREAEVEIATWYPVLQCGLDPSEAKKTSAEYRLV